MTPADLHEHIEPYLLPGLILKSRIHPLHTYFGHPDARQVWIKRDDELSSGIAGSKYRKYASIIKHIIDKQYDEVVLIGGAQSNNIVGLLQLLLENRIAVKPMLLKSHIERLTGNGLWIRLLTRDTNVITWIEREEWPQVNQIAINYQQEEERKGKNVLILPEGGAIPESLPGAMTLGWDIAQFEVENNISFDHIFIDSGTGTTASGLLLAMSALKKDLNNVHITLIAGTEQEFLKQYEAFYNWTAQYLPLSIWDTNFSFHKSLIAPSFGSVNQKVLEEVKRMAATEGILMEPVYSIKHFYTAQYLINENNLSGNILVIYSGGALGLAGFQDKLA